MSGREQQNDEQLTENLSANQTDCGPGLWEFWHSIRRRRRDKDLALLGDSFWRIQARFSDFREISDEVLDRSDEQPFWLRMRRLRHLLRELALNM